MNSRRSGIPLLVHLLMICHSDAAIQNRPGGHESVRFFTIGPFNPAEIGPFNPAQNGPFCPALTNKNGQKTTKATGY